MTLNPDPRPPISGEQSVHSLEDYLAVSNQLFSVGCEKRDIPTIELAGTLGQTALQLHKLYKAFPASPRRHVDGPQGMTRQLRLSRNAIYIRLKSLGLSINDFHEVETNESLLFSRSSVMAQLLADAKGKLPAQNS